MDDHDDQPQTTIFNGVEHEVCGSCGSVAGHGCPESEPCDCDEEEAPDEPPKDRHQEVFEHVVKLLAQMYEADESLWGKDLPKIDEKKTRALMAAGRLSDLNNVDFGGVVWLAYAARNPAVLQALCERHRALKAINFGAVYGQKPGRPGT